VLTVGRLASAVAVLALAPALSGCGGEDDEASTTTAPTVSTTPTAPAPRPATLAGAARLVRRDLDGIPQKGLVLGTPRAPVTVVEYADLTCAPCAAAHRGLVPTLVERYVRSGEASLELRPLATNDRARGLARSAFAAGLQERGWHFVQLAALRSGEGAATVAPREPDAQIAAALGLDLAVWRRDRTLPRWQTELLADANVAAVARFAGLPVFLVRGRDAADAAFTIVTQPRTVEELADAIEQARP
jgi:protein-disulfide isomerase